MRYSMDEINDLIDEIIDRIKDSSPRSKCFDEDTIRSVLADTLILSNENRGVIHVRNRSGRGSCVCASGNR